MPKNIVICCDGTNNQFAGHHTNVIRAYRASLRTERQVTYYDPGVGTMPEPWNTTNLGKRWEILKGLIYGEGLFENISDAYRFLISNYEPGDKIFLFGFSRGAFTTRAVAAVLHSVGLLHPATDSLLPYALRYWERDFGPTSEGGKLCSEFKAALARPCPVHFIGVWDTVSSVGYINHFKTFPYTARNSNVTCVRHAVSIDERRSTFRQNLMSPVTPEQDIKNIYFAGVHSDVGGGYPAEESGLAKLTFEWMIREATQAGLEIDQARFSLELRTLGAPPNPAGPIHRSLGGFWWLGELLPMRRYSWKDKKKHWYWLRGAYNQARDLMRGAALPYVGLHRSVIERINLVQGYRPMNLPAGEEKIRAAFRIEE